MATKTEPKKPVLMMSGHCATAHLTRHPDEAHARCMMPYCPHPWHYAGRERYDCEGCDFKIVETDWENTDPEDIDEDGNRYPVYTHLDREGRAIGQDCPR